MISVLLLIIGAVLAVGALTGVVVWLASVRPASMAQQTLSAPTTGSPHVPLPPLAAPGSPSALTSSSIDGLRFGMQLRGYAMREVDAALDRLRDELSSRDAEIDRLRRELDAARTRTGDPELGHGPVVRAPGEDSLWSSGSVRSYQAGSGADTRHQVPTDPYLQRPVGEERPDDRPDAVL